MAKFRKVTQIRNLVREHYVVKVVGRVLLFAKPAKSLINLHTAQDFAEYVA